MRAPQKPLRPVGLAAEAAQRGGVGIGLGFVVKPQTSLFLVSLAQKGVEGGLARSQHKFDQAVCWARGVQRCLPRSGTARYPVQSPGISWPQSCQQHWFCWRLVRSQSLVWAPSRADSAREKSRLHTGLQDFAPRSRTWRGRQLLQETPPQAETRRIFEVSEPASMDPRVQACSRGAEAAKIGSAVCCKTHAVVDTTRHAGAVQERLGASEGRHGCSRYMPPQQWPNGAT